MTNRTHSQIIRTEGVSALREKLATVGIEVADPTVRSWERRNDGAGSIPAEYWQAFATLEIATLEELAAAKSLAAMDGQEAAA